jgi:hypothetical protein
MSPASIMGLILPAVGNAAAVFEINPSCRKGVSILPAVRDSYIKKQKYNNSFILLKQRFDDRHAELGFTV